LTADFCPPFTSIDQGVRLAGVAGRDAELPHRADRGQGLAAEAERGDLHQVVAVKLGGGMALDRKLEVGAAHAGAVVGDTDQPAAAAVGRDLDAGRAGIERVFDQLLDHAGRAFDHLAGGDAVDGGFGQAADGHCGLSAIRGRILRPQCERNEGRRGNSPAIPVTS
jgi:hypothetical protein